MEGAATRAEGTVGSTPNRGFADRARAPGPRPSSVGSAANAPQALRTPHPRPRARRAGAGDCRCRVVGWWQKRSWARSGPPGNLRLTTSSRPGTTGSPALRAGRLTARRNEGTPPADDGRTRRDRRSQRPPRCRGRVAVAAPRLPPAPPRGARDHGDHRARRGRSHHRHPAGHQGAHRRPDRPARARSPGPARPARPGPRHPRGGADLPAPLGAVQRRARHGDHHAARPLRAPPAAADGLPRPVAVRAAALPGDQRPVEHPAVLRLRPAVPGDEHPPARGRHPGAAEDVLAARPGRRGRVGPDRHAVQPLRAPLRADLPAGPGPAGRPGHGGRGGRGRHPGHQELRARTVRVRPLQRVRAHALRHLHGQGPAVREVLDLPRGDPQRRGGRRAAVRRPRRRPRRPHTGHPRRLHHPDAVAGVADRVPRLHPRDGAGGDDRGRPDPGDLRHPALHRLGRPGDPSVRAATCGSRA